MASTRSSRNQNLYVRIVSEGLLRLHPLFTAHAAENADHRILASQERGDALFQIAQRVAMFGEDHQLWADGGPAPFRDSFSMGPGVKISESRFASSRHFRSVPLRRTARASPSRCFQSLDF